MREIEAVREIYFEVMDFITSCGGSYRNLHSSTCLNIIDALAHNRYLLHREDGRLKRALFWWMVRPEDLETVKQGIPPDDRDSGSIVYFCEAAGVDGSRGLARAVREMKDRYPADTDACWHNHWTAPDRFVYYRRTK